MSATFATAQSMPPPAAAATNDSAHTLKPAHAATAKGFAFANMPTAEPTRAPDTNAIMQNGIYVAAIGYLTAQCSQKRAIVYCSRMRTNS